MKIDSDLTRLHLRQSILEEERLSWEVTKERRLRREDPPAWARLEAERRQWNDRYAAVNARLRALGLEPVVAGPSLQERERKLQRLRRRNLAAIASLTAAKVKTPRKSPGTVLAPSRRRRKR